MIGFKNASGPIFEKIQKDAAGKKRSREWYRSSLIKYLNEIPEDDENPDDGSRENDVQVGEMYFFTYTAKFPERYPWYDSFPLVFVTEITKESFLGANLHYLSPTVRSGYAQSLINNEDGVIVPNKTIHRYLFSQISSSFSRVPPSDYIGVSVLPTEKFVDKTGDDILSRKIWRS